MVYEMVTYAVNALLCLSKSTKHVAMTPSTFKIRLGF